MFGKQWRSKALRGPGSTVTWGPPFPSTSISPSPSPPLPLLFPSPALPRVTKRSPNPATEPGERYKLHQRGLGSNLVHFSLKISHLVATIIMIFLRVLPIFFCGPSTWGAPGARGPRFIEPPEPPVPTPLLVNRRSVAK